MGFTKAETDAKSSQTRSILIRRKEWRGREGRLQLGPSSSLFLFSCTQIKAQVSRGWRQVRGSANVAASLEPTCKVSIFSKES